VVFHPKKVVFHPKKVVFHPKKVVFRENKAQNQAVSKAPKILKILKV
jgi:hypothetical protein